MVSLGVDFHSLGEDKLKITFFGCGLDYDYAII